jgi:hypothetical protein
LPVIPAITFICVARQLNGEVVIPGGVRKSTPPMMFGAAAPMAWGYKGFLPRFFATKRVLAFHCLLVAARWWGVADVGYG